jgi:hypothetical protein
MKCGAECIVKRLLLVVARDKLWYWEIIVHVFGARGREVLQNFEVYC